MVCHVGLKGIADRLKTPNMIIGMRFRFLNEIEKANPPDSSPAILHAMHAVGRFMIAEITSRQAQATNQNLIAFCVSLAANHCIAVTRPSTTINPSRKGMITPVAPTEAALTSRI